VDNKHFYRSNYAENMTVNSDDWLAIRQMISGGGGLPPVDTYWRDDAGQVFTDDSGSPFTTD